MMQKKVQIISDGSLDLSQELTKEKDIEVVPFYVSFDSETYQKEMVEVGVREFYQEMVDHPTVFPKTSMPSVHDYYEVFEKYAKEKMPVICICITRKFSGSLQSATTAKDMILEEYPDAQITVIDSTVNTVLQGLYVLEACRLRDMGLEYQQIVDALLPIRETGRIFFTIGSIDYLKHGGRIGKLAGIAASALKIKPLITLKEGEIFNSGITRNRLKSMKKEHNIMLAGSFDDLSGKVIRIGHMGNNANFEDMTATMYALSETLTFLGVNLTGNLVGLFLKYYH